MTCRLLMTDDESLGLMLTCTWSLITGRTLRSDVPPAELTEQELIDFWAEDEPLASESPRRGVALGRGQRRG
jgi:hypothetical protein